MKKYLLLFFSLLLISVLSAQQYRLVFPKDGFVTSNTNITFKWSVVDNATSYELQIASDEFFSFLLFQPSAPVTSYTQTLTLGSTYYWRIRATIGGNAQAWSYSRSVSIFSPTQLGGLVMWLDAAQNVTQSGGAISQWNDLSPSGLLATQTNTVNKPTLVTGVSQLCGKPVVHFNGLNNNNTNYLDFPTLNLTEYTALIVRNYTQLPQPPKYMQYVLGGPQCGLCAESNYYNGGFGTYSSLQNANALYASVPSVQLPGFSIYTTQKNHIFRNSTEFANCPPSANHSNSVIPSVSLSGIGTRPDNKQLSYQGDIAEIVMYDNSLDSVDRELAERYLRYKFAPPVNLGPDTIFDRFCVNVNLSSASCFSSYLWSTGATTASINVTAIGTYWVRATDFFGYVSSDTINIRPQIAFNQLPQNVFLCAGDSLTWNTGYPATGYQFTWSPVANTTSIVIKMPGNYSVAIKDAFNCTFNSAVVQVTVDNFPNYSLGADTSFCSGNRLNFVYPNPLTSILWSTGDTTNETVINTTGNYSVVAENNNGCLAEDTIHVFIKGIAPTVNYTNPTLCATDTISFVDSSIPPNGNALVSWIWDFGNGDLDSVQNTTHVFGTSGTYPVSLTVYTDSGCLNTITKNLSVYLKPQAHFQAKVSCALAQTQFIDLSDTTSSAIAQWKWHFTNADSSFFKNPTFAFPTQGKYGVSLKVTNNNGCSDFISDSIEVFAPFSADFNFEKVCFGDSTSFTDITSSLSLVSWLWNTGDNFFSTKKNFKHKYGTFGNKTVTLQIQNAIGCVDSVSKSFTIYKSPTAAFTDLVSCEDQYYTPLDASTVYETSNTWKWNIAGTNYNGQVPQHFFVDTGNYTVKLLVTSQSGCKDSTSHLVHVTPNPTAAFSFTPLYGDAPLNVVFDNQSINANSYFWNFGDGATDNSIAPSHVYSANGTFEISLTATSDFGCVDSATKNIQVIPTDLDIAVDYVETTSAPQADGTVLISVTVYAHNEGTRLITDVTFYSTIGSGGVISENWDTLIQSGESKYYLFNANFVVAAANANSYVCVEAKSVNDGEAETRIDNNRQCASVNGVMQVVGPSPNPARGSAYLGLILPKAGKVTIDIVDVLGRIVTQPEELDLPAGRTDYDLPVKLLRAGEYFIRLKHNDDKLLQKLVVH